MAKNRVSQRGVVRVASSLLVAGMGALLSVAGCSAEGGPPSPAATEENLGSRQEAITCNVLGAGCPPDDTCGNWTCPKGGGNCTVLVLTPDGERCTDPEKNTGLCVAGSCCTSGCAAKTKLGYECRRGTELNFCGQPGTACDNCAGTDQCTSYVCSTKRLCDSAPVADGEACASDPGTCSGGKCCTGCFANGVCQPGTDVKLCGVGGAEKCENCDDGNPCTDDICGPKGCEHPAVEAGKSCDADSNLCNGTAKCDGTVCKTSPPVICNDGNPCTNDACAPATGQCVYTNNTANCSDGDVCTTGDKCSGGKCLGTGALTCDDNEACTVDSCDKALGCQYKPVADNTMCDDGNACSTGDKCVAGKCAFVAGKNCNDDNPCTQDACANNICGPVNEPNGTKCVFDACHVNSQCQAGDCVKGTPLVCDDGNPCTTDSCDAATGCKYVPLDSGACSDGDLCTVEDKCTAGKCVGVEMTCTPIDECHLAGSCNEKTGTCDDPRAPDDTECEGGKGKCVTGKCDVPTTGDGGAGGEGPTGQGGDGAGATGGAPVTGEGGEGNAPSSGGEATTPGGGTSGTGNNNDAGQAVDPTRVFQREPGGCSCSVPASGPSSLSWLAGIGFAALVVARRRGREARRVT